VTLADLAWPDVDAVAEATVLAVPLGSTEQHGPHLPLSTDTDIAIALAHRLASAAPGVRVAPAVAYGASGEHAGFAGTLSIGTDVLAHLIVELVRSADAFAGVVLVCGHGGNARAVAAAVETLTTEGRRVLAWAPSGAADAHAGRTETSLMLALAPGRVALSRAARGDTRPLAELAPVLRSGGIAAVSPNGVLGDPAGASAEEGALLLEAMAADLVASVASWRRR
jgi:mycofactocin system creatininase family protein